jgi:hypothetical protein
MRFTRFAALATACAAFPASPSPAFAADPKDNPVIEGAFR